MSYSWGAPRRYVTQVPTWEGVVFNHGDRIPLRMWAKACCGNPTPILSTDHRGRPIIMCANCGNRT